MYSYAIVRFLQKDVAAGKRQVTRAKKNNEQKGGVHKDQHRGACTPHSMLCRSEDSHSLHTPVFQRLPSDAAYSAALWLARHGKTSNLSEATMPLKNRYEKRSKLRAEHPIKKRRALRSSEERYPRHASPVSVVFAVDRVRCCCRDSHDYRCYYYCCCCCACLSARGMLLLLLLWAPLRQEEEGVSSRTQNAKAGCMYTHAANRQGKYL